MPYIETKVSVAISKEKEQRMKERLGQAISLIPGKSEQLLMLRFEDNCRMYFGGTNDAPSAFVEVRILHDSTREAYESMTKAIMAILSEELAIDPARVYIKYSPGDDWGWNGGNF